MKQIAIIGAGELGSRHLQALAMLEGAVTITVVDPSEKARSVARERFVEVARGHGPKVVFVGDIGELPGALDLAIVATSAAVRMAVIRQLLSSTVVPTLVLEKVLFQRVAEYDEAARLFSLGKVSVWVNCPRRMMPFYKRVGEYITGDRPFTFTAEGVNWGLCCNAIHLIDNCAMYARCAEYTLDRSALQNVIIPSKRDGFIELNGRLEGRFANGSRFVFTCEDGEQWRLVNRIENDAYLVEIDLKENAAVITESATGAKSVFSDISVRQSLLSHKVVEELLASGTCELTPYDESVMLHRPLVEGLLAQVNALLPTPTDALAIT